MDINQLTREIILACREANLTKLQQLITPQNVNWVFDDYMHTFGTPLFLVAAYGNEGQEVACLEFLISQGADVNWSGSGGNTALFMTITPAVARLLVKAGANINGRNKRGLTPLQDTYIIEGIDPKCIGWDEEEIEFVKCLLDLGADVLNDCPKWIKSMSHYRQACKSAAITLLGIKKFRRSPIIDINNRDVIRLISQDMWSLRFKTDPEK